MDTSEWKKKKNVLQHWSELKSFGFVFPSVFFSIIFPLCTFGGHVRSTCSFAYKLLCFFFFFFSLSFRCSKYILCFVYTQRTRWWHFHQKCWKIVQKHNNSIYLFHFIWLTLHSTMDHAHAQTIDCDINSKFVLLLFSLVHFVVLWILGISVSTWKWCCSRQTTFYLEYFSLSPSHLAMRLTTSQNNTAAWTKTTKMEKWKPKHINNYGSSSETESFSFSSFRVFFLPSFGLYIVHNYLLVPIHNK